MCLISEGESFEVCYDHRYDTKAGKEGRRTGTKESIRSCRNDYSHTTASSPPVITASIIITSSADGSTYYTNCCCHIMLNAFLLVVCGECSRRIRMKLIKP